MNTMEELKKNLKPFFEHFETIVTSIIVLFIIYSTIAFPELVVGSSMEPNFYTGERILVEKVSSRFVPYKRGDVVVLHPPGNDGIDYVKRIVGLPGETVQILDCKVYISQGGDRYVYVETYLRDNNCTEGGPALKEGRSYIIEDDSYFVMGDNREKSADSRFFGTVKRERILGKVVYRFWPFDKSGIIRTY